jgi:hypothetical protein
MRSFSVLPRFENSYPQCLVSLLNPLVMARNWMERLCVVLNGTKKREEEQRS